jgi:Zn-dependent M28 family amino/carboxypeptidase
MTVRPRQPWLVAMAAFLCLYASNAFAQAVAAPTAAVTPRFTAEELIADVKTLASPSFEGRRVGTPGNAKARAWIVERFREAGLIPFGDAFQLPFQFTRAGVSSSGVNVAGWCRGSGARDNGVIVITAHYDHLGVRDGATFFGADDNASGVAVLLALARQCRATPFTHDVVFVAFDAEEGGLQGARAFVAAPPVAKERIALNVNLDMVSRGDKEELYAVGTYHRPALKAVLDPVVTRAPIKLLFGHDKPKDVAGGIEDWTMQSDHGPFHAAGIPFIYFGVEDHPDYHKATDTPEKINPDFFFKAATTILDAVTALDRALPLPKP